MRKSVFFLLLRLYAVFLFSACHGVDSRESTAQTVRTNAFRSLRLGQTESPNSPVATTAASNNGEAIIILNRAPGLNTVEHVLYLSSASEVARISFNDGKLPSSAQAGDVTLNFSNFTPRSVDVQVVSPDATPVTVTIPLDDVIGKFITQLPESAGRTGRAAPASLQREAESDEVLRVLYSRALIAVRLFGCGSLATFSQAGIAIPVAFQSVSQSACGSQLTELLRAFLAAGDFSANTIFGLAEEPTCDFSQPSWSANFLNAQQCALGTGGELLSTILELFPPLDVAVLGTPTPTPTPSPTPRPPSPDEDEDSDNDEPALRCNEGRFRCADGSRACNEDACNGVSDCNDGSDESPTVCTAEVLCCIASAGCPGEGAGTCSAACCCCPGGFKCSRSPYLDGCVTAEGRSIPESWFP